MSDGAFAYRYFIREYFMNIKTVLVLLSCIVFSPLSLSVDFTPDFNIRIRLDASVSPVPFEFRGDQVAVSRGIKVKCVADKTPTATEVCKIKNTSQRAFGGHLVTSTFYDYKMLLSGDELEIASGDIFYLD